MAIGDAASNEGLPLVPNTGSDDSKVRHGAREINRTRDFIANIMNWSKGTHRQKTGISMGTSTPSNSTGDNNDIFFRY